MDAKKIVPESLLAGIVDTHCHLTRFVEYSVLRRRLRRLGIGVMVMSTTPEEYLQINAHFTDDEWCFPCLGLYPLEISPERTQAFFNALPTARFIGEVGLDYTIEDEDRHKQQRNIFHRILIECAQVGNKILSVHSRRASRDVVDMVGRSFPGTVIMHWFSGSPEMAARAADAVYFSINTAMVASKRGKTLIKSLNPERILLESDGPFVEYEGRKATPLDGVAVVYYLSQIWREDPQVVAALLRKNTHRALGGGYAQI